MSTSSFQEPRALLQTALLAGALLLHSVAWAVGPPPSSDRASPVSGPAVNARPLTVIVPVFDPNIPDDPDDYAKKGVWPELRNTESKLFALSVRDALARTGRFEAVRATPNEYAIGELYVLGQIERSTSEEIELKINVVDITGGRWMKDKKFKYRVREYDLTSPRTASDDPYQPIFDSIAAEIVSVLRRLDNDDEAQLKDTSSVVLGRSYSDETFGPYVEDRRGRIKLTGVPAANDRQYQRILSVRAREELFVDDLQAHYDAFAGGVTRSYREWQRQSFLEAKEYREARAKSNRQIGLAAGLAALAVVGAVAADADGRPTDEDGRTRGDNAAKAVAAAAALAAAGLGYKAFRNRRESRAHFERLSESGRQLDLELVPTNVEFEGRTEELTGNAEEQFSRLREFLQQVYAEERTPGVQL